MVSIVFFECFQNLLISKSIFLNTLFSDVKSSLKTLLFLLSCEMISAVNFKRNFELMAIKVQHIEVYKMLPSEFKSLWLCLKELTQIFSGLVTFPQLRSILINTRISAILHTRYLQRIFAHNTMISEKPPFRVRERFSAIDSKPKSN
jgi:poly(3-hydroxyalkanoate) synthetase